MDDHAGHDPDDGGRTTAPMQAFSAREAGVGAVVLLVGLALTFGLAVAL
jgi:hypothetical protein